MSAHAPHNHAPLEEDGRWPLVACVYRRAELLTDVMRLTGASPLAAARMDQGSAIVTARHNCLVCPHLGPCHEWMVRADANSEPPDFCPNADFLKACRKN